MKTNTEQYKKQFVDAIHKIAKDKELLENFIKDILTDKEFDNLGMRWEIVKRLQKGEHHHAIAEALGLGVATVSRGSKEIHKKNSGLKKALRVIHK